MIYLILFNILFIPFIICSNAVQLPNKSDINHSLLSSHLLNDTKLPLLSEGGSVIPHASDLALPKETHNIPSLENDTGKSRIKPRKEAIYTEDKDTKSQETVVQSNENNSTSQPSASGEQPKLQQQKNATKNISMQESNSTVLNEHTEERSGTTTPVPKKPLRLNADKLLRSSLEVNPSHDTIVTNQLQSPNKEKAYIAKANANSHPGMVMPIVITILLVPMFAVLGYMALRRGQEAWKNRHYKRMDFLLDGMYND